MFEDIKLESWKDLTSDFFSKYFSPTNNQDKDPGYSIFIKITQIFTSNSRAYLFIIAIIFFLSLGKFLKEHTESLQELLFSYVFYINLFNGYVPNSAIRQTLAISIILFAYTNLQKKRCLLFFCLRNPSIVFSQKRSYMFVGSPYDLSKKYRQTLLFGDSFIFINTFMCQSVRIIIFKQQRYLQWLS